SMAPGSFVAMTHLSGEESAIQNWEAINEEFFIFPSSTARQVRSNESNAFEQFKGDMEQFMGRSLGIVGRGRYKNDT
ncbi:CamS family sex pheromone protein, partial [Pseudomonas sp. 2822-17]|uniref:CamS family sex pheromone protein n=1 Tax=Pseudomonas sp. 2822-17 TaxID=1712678 RepID=UPI0015ABCF5D